MSEWIGDKLFEPKNRDRLADLKDHADPCDYLIVGSRLFDIVFTYWIANKCSGSLCYAKGKSPRNKQYLYKYHSGGLSCLVLN